MQVEKECLQDDEIEDDDHNSISNRLKLSQDQSDKQNANEKCKEYHHLLHKAIISYENDGK